MGTPRDPWQERRELMQFLVTDRSKNGTTFSTPPGIPLTEPSLLDNIQPILLIQQLVSGRKVDLARCVVPDDQRRVLPRAPSASQLRQLSQAAVAATASAKGLNHQQSSAAMESPNPFHTSQAPPQPWSDNPFLTPAVDTNPSTNNPFLELPSARPPLPSRTFPSTASTSLPTNATYMASAIPPPTSIPPTNAPYRAYPPPPPANAPVASTPAQIAAMGASFAGTKLQYNQHKGQKLTSREGGDSEAGSSAAGMGDTPMSDVTVGPEINLPQLDAGVTGDQLRELAYLTICACCQASSKGYNPEMINVFRRQLEMLRHIPVGMQPAQSATLELVVRLLEGVRPLDFSSRTPFRAFLQWRDTMTATLDRCFSRNVAEYWTAGDAALSRRLMARLKGSIRRMDVRSEEELDEDEYAEALSVMSSTARALTGCCRIGWSYTWGMRVRIGEVLLQAMFETLEGDESCYIDDSVIRRSYTWGMRVRIGEVLLQAMFETLEGDESCYIDDSVQAGLLLESHVWPLLGISPLLHLAINAWVHFRQYVRHEDPRLLRQVKALTSRLAAEVSKEPSASDPFGLGQEVVATDEAYRNLRQDLVLAEQVGNQVIEFALDRLRDYYVACPSGQGVQGILDILVSASQSRGNDDQQLAQILVGIVQTSTEVEFGRRIRTALRGDESEALKLRTMLQLAVALRDDNEALYYRPLSVYLMPEGAAEAVCCAQLNKLLGKHLGPWLSSVSHLDETTSGVFMHALATDHELMVAVDEVRPRLVIDTQMQGGNMGGQASNGGASHEATPVSGVAVAVADALRSCRPWDITSTLWRVQSSWVNTQVNNMETWVKRQLQTETWRAVSPGREGYATFAVEVSKLMLDAVDTLFDMALPIPKAVVVLLLEGIDGRLQKCAAFISNKLGPLDPLVPPLPPLTRYKKDVVAKQEKAELDIVRLGPAAAAKKQLKVVESVSKIESSPAFMHINSSLTNSVLTSCIHSAHYLLSRTDFFMQSVSQKWAYSSKRFSRPVVKGHIQQQQHMEGSPSTIDVLPEGLLMSSRASLAKTIELGCSFLAYKITFWDLRQEWLEQLYRHHVQPKSLDTIVDRLNHVLAGTCPAMPEDLRSIFVKSLLRASMQAMERVLLDGGPCRWFIPSDVSMLESDLWHLHQLFHADGDGLPMDDIESELVRVKNLLQAMSLETAPLMDLLKQAKGRGAGTTMWRGQQLTFRENDALRLLAHRPEWAGSKVLKEEYKIGKKIKS
eukprot:gene3064-13083_t